MSIPGRLLKLIARLAIHISNFLKACLLRLRSRRKLIKPTKSMTSKSTATKGTQTSPDIASSMNRFSRRRTAAATARLRNDVTVLPSSQVSTVANSQRADRHTTASIETVLPPEILALICDFLYTTDMFSFRNASQSFCKAAHTAYCRTIDKRSYPVTCNELTRLKGMLELTQGAVHFKTFRIDTQFVCNCQRGRYRAWMKTNRTLSVSPLSSFGGCFPRGSDDGSGCAILLAQIVRLMTNLKKIVLSENTKRRETTWMPENEAFIGGFIFSPWRVSSAELPWTQNWAAWRSLDVLVRAFGEGVAEGATPTPMKLSLKTAFPVEALPSQTSPISNSRLFVSLTRLRLNITFPNTSLARMSNRAADQYLPEFLKTLPATLEDLSITFPKDSHHPRIPYPILGLTSAASGDHTFEGVATHHIYFPQLRNLHLTNLTLGSAQLLRRFLLPHASTLRNICLTSLALTGQDWRPFIGFFRTSMKLDKLVLDSNLTEAERAWDLAIWESTPLDQRLLKVDYLGTSKETLLNGVRVDQSRAGAASVERGGEFEYEADEEEMDVYAA